MLEIRSETFKIKLLEFRQKLKIRYVMAKVSSFERASPEYMARHFGLAVARIARDQDAVPVLDHNHVMILAYYGPQWAPD